MDGINYLSNLIERNIISEPVLIIKSMLQKANKNIRTLSAVKYNFNNFNNQILKSSLSEWSLNNPITSDYSLNNGNFTLKEQYLKYDEYGNIIYFTDKHNMKFIYIWSYKGKYPIAEIKEATYAQVCSVLGRAPETFSNEISPNMDEINVLRIKLPRASINTFTYKPLIGLITSTNPQGITTYYEYDSLGRLNASYVIQDGRREYIEEYIYHYK